MGQGRPLGVLILRCGGFEQNEIPKNRIKETSSDKAPTWNPCGMGISPTRITKLINRLDTIAAIAAGAVARFQLNPTLSGMLSSILRCVIPTTMIVALRRESTS